MKRSAEPAARELRLDEDVRPVLRRLPGFRETHFEDRLRQAASGGRLAEEAPGPRDVASVEAPPAEVLASLSRLAGDRPAGGEGQDLLPLLEGFARDMLRHLKTANRNDPDGLLSEVLTPQSKIDVHLLK